MDCALDLYDDLNGLSDKRLLLVIQNVEDLIYSKVHGELPKKRPDIAALNLYKTMEGQEHPIDNLSFVFLELVAVIKDKRKIEVPTEGILRQQ